jgi:hypothetical protein
VERATDIARIRSHQLTFAKGSSGLPNIGGFEDETISAKFPKKPNNKNPLKTENLIGISKTVSATHRNNIPSKCGINTNVRNALSNHSLLTGT